MEAREGFGGLMLKSMEASADFGGWGLRCSILKPWLHEASRAAGAPP